MDYHVNYYPFEQSLNASYNKKSGKRLFILHTELKIVGSSFCTGASHPISFLSSFIRQLIFRNTLVLRIRDIKIEYYGDFWIRVELI